MSNWAIVIGVDQYKQPEHALKAAVSDALRVCDWLLASDGGNVPPSQMRLLLSPCVPHGIPLNVLPADRVSVINAINDVLKQSNGQGGRLFFYFAGHGMSARVDLTNLSAILMSDFHTDFPDQSLSLQSLFDHCQSARFDEQYFIFDACRDIVFAQQEIRIGYIPRPRQPIISPPPQYVVYATQAGAKAMELRTPGTAGGAFTTALLDGLTGKRSAKSWNPENQRYEVHWSTLINFVREEIKKRKLIVGTGTDGPVTQEPRTYGETDGKDPVLAGLSPRTVEKEDLKISVQPSSLVSGATLQVRDIVDDYHASPPLTQPHVFSLPPRRYNVAAMMPGYEVGRKFIDLYEAQELTLELRPPGPSDPGLPGTDLPAVTRGIVFSRRDDGPKTGTPSSSVPLIAQSPDLLARVELISNSGTVITSRRGRATAKIGPGFYRTRVTSPDGSTFEESFEVSGFEHRVLINTETPVAMTPTMDALLSLGSFDSKADGTIKVSEAIGDAAFMQASTVLALSAAAKIEGNDTYGQRLRRLPLPSFPELTGSAASGAQLLLGDDNAKYDRWKQTSVRLIPQKYSAPSHERPALQTDVPGVFSSAHELSPGPYWLEVSTNHRREFSMPIHVISDHVALVVLMQTPESGLKVYCYQVRTRSNGTRQSYDPQFVSCRFAALRRIELMQRSVAEGRLTPIVPDLEEMLKLEWLDPLAASLGCYALIRLGRFPDVKRLADALLQRFPELPDPWIAHACYADHTQDHAARDYSSQRAFETGCSSFRDGIKWLRRLLVDADTAHAEHLDRFEHRIIPDSPWTASHGALSRAWNETAEAPSMKVMPDVHLQSRGAN